MSAMLQKYSEEHVYRVPEGLRELCTDIAREVLRSQPKEMYRYIADYVDALLITRENAKIAVTVVNNILLGSQAIISVLHRSGFSLEQIAMAAPRIQKAFRAYLDEVDVEATQPCDDQSCEEISKVSLKDILERTGATVEQAEKAAIIIQAAFRGHYERMVQNESQGIIQWQRAVANTLEILRKAGVSPSKASETAAMIQSAYRGYYTRRNLRLKLLDAEKEDGKDIGSPRDTIQAVAWLEMMYEDSGLTHERTNEAAAVIQRAYRKHRGKRGSYAVRKIESSRTVVVETVLENLRQRIFHKVMSREDVPEEYNDREEMEKAAAKLRLTLEDHLKRRVVSEEKSMEKYIEAETSEEIHSMKLQTKDVEEELLETREKDDIGNE